MSAFENVSSFTEMFSVADAVSGGYLAVGFPIVFFIAIFGFTLNYGRAHALTSAAFLTAPILLVENMTGLVDFWVIIADLVLLSLGLVMITLERRSMEV